MYRFLFNTCTFNVRIFENIVKNLWARIEDIDEEKSCKKKKSSIIPKFYKMKELTLVDVYTKGLLKIPTIRLKSHCLWFDRLCGPRFDRSK